MTSRKGKTGTMALRADIELSEGKAPSRIRLLRQGVNESDYGPFLFDELSAAMVMGSFQADGKPRLYGDWNHGMLDKQAGREKGAACCSFYPEVVGGELWAADIQWTEDGRADVEGRRYNYFSPAFTYDFGEDGQCRPRKLINFALVNRAGLKDIEPLLAASAAAIEEEKRAMDEKLETELRGRIATLEAENKALKGASSDVVALRSAVGGPADAPIAANVAAITSLVALRGEVFKVTGQSTPESAVGALQALKVKADRTDALEAEREAEKTIALRAELDAVWKGADDEKKITPAQRPVFEASILAAGGGKVTRAAVDAAKTLVASLSAQVIGTPTPAPAGSVTLSPERMAIAKLMGRDPKAVAEYEAKRLGATG